MSAVAITGYILIVYGVSSTFRAQYSVFLELFWLLPSTSWDPHFMILTDWDFMATAHLHQHCFIEDSRAFVMVDHVAPSITRISSKSIIKVYWMKYLWWLYGSEVKPNVTVLTSTSEDKHSPGFICQPKTAHLSLTQDMPQICFTPICPLITTHIMRICSVRRTLGTNLWL